MGVEQREALRKRRSRRETALARRGLACAFLWMVALAEGSPQAEPSTKENTPNGRKTTDAVKLPSHTRGDTGRVADPRNLHGDSKIENANATSPADEHVVRPIPSALRAGDSGDTTEPPPFQLAPAAPAPNYLPPSSNVWSAPPRPWAGTVEHQPSPAQPTPIDAGNGPDVFARSPAQELVDEKPQPVTERAQLALMLTEPADPLDQRNDRESKSKSGKTEAKVEAAPPMKPEDPAGPTILDLVRAEIKSRLPYFQACADSARRRRGIEIRRLQATWFINADGTIKEFRLDEAPDKELAACLLRAGSRPFPVQPGMDLAIPTPIVFVR